jgi:glucosamine-6-phosphate deaminase
MEVIYHEKRRDGGAAAAGRGAEFIRRALADRGEANIILATGLSQFDMLPVLAAEDIAWEKVNAFHLDEYVGLSIRHPASFRAVLWREFARKLPVPLKSFHWINGEGDPEAERRRLEEAVSRHPIDVAFVGIGENGHLAFNDPPADFFAESSYLVVKLDDRCRRQQLGEGWFKSLEEVPERAISMSIRQIMKSAHIVVTCPDGRKAEAVRDCLEGEVDNLHPASILRCHPAVWLYLDAASAARLSWKGSRILPEIPPPWGNS